MSIIDVVNQLPIHATARYRKRNLSDISGIVVHHTTGSITSSGTLPPAIARFHVSRNFPGIAYHYFIDANGQTYLTQRLDTVSWHCGQPNSHTIGIALRGNFTTLLPTAAQQNSLVKLIMDIRNMPNFDIVRIAGHGQYPGASASACPGASSPQWLPNIIKAAMGSGIFTPVTSPSQPQPPPAPQPQTPSTPQQPSQPVTLEVIRRVNIRTEPTDKAYKVAVRNVGDKVSVLGISIESPNRVWVWDKQGWSAIVHSNLIFMR